MKSTEYYSDLVSKIYTLSVIGNFTAEEISKEIGFKLSSEDINRVVDAFEIELFLAFKETSQKD